MYAFVRSHYAYTIINYIEGAQTGQANFSNNMTLTMPHFRKILRGHVRTVSRNMEVKFESVALNVLVLVRGRQTFVLRHTQM